MAFTEFEQENIDCEIYTYLAYAIKVSRVWCKKISNKFPRCNTIRLLTNKLKLAKMVLSMNPSVTPLSIYSEKEINFA